LLREKDGLTVICPLDDGEILQLTTTNRGGYSTGAYASFNTALHVGDNYMNVIKNLEKLKSSWGINRLVMISQIHSAVIHEVTGENIAEVMFSEGDGLFTKERDIALGIHTADCWNVHLIGRKCLASLHCGWKSTASGIVENALEMFRREGDSVIKAVVGPGISTACYEVGGELTDAFISRGHGQNIENIGGKTCFSIGGAIRNILKKAGVSEIISVPYCTFSEDFLYSYRRDSGRTGRMLSLLMRK
jgi:YfiH family protein